jgi:hypothetical protein
VCAVEAGLSICREDCMNSDGHRTPTLPLIVVLGVIIKKGRPRHDGQYCAYVLP